MTKMKIKCQKLNLGLRLSRSCSHYKTLCCLWTRHEPHCNLFTQLTVVLLDIYGVHSVSICAPAVVIRYVGSCVSYRSWYR